MGVLEKMTYEALREEYLELIEAIKGDYAFVDIQTHGDCHFFKCSHVFQPEKYLVITSGIHGVEGYIGTQMIMHFLKTHRKRLNPNKVGLIFINFINAYGMKTFTRNNKDNIDLNRNFMAFDQQTYEKMDTTLPHPYFSGQWVGSNTLLNELKFIREVLPLYFSKHWKPVMNKVFKGQYISKDYPFYGGAELTCENKMLIQWLTPYYESDSQIILLDLHTGIGDFGQMTFILDQNEPERTFLWKMKLGSPNVYKTGEGQMYDVSGDFTHYWYEHFPNQNHTGITVEFGIKKDNLLTSFISAMQLVIENGARLNGFKTPTPNYVNLFYTEDTRWWYLAKEQFKQGIDGIFLYFDLI